METTQRSIPDDVTCKHCGCEPQKTVCDGCGVAAMLTNCGHMAQPRPIASDGPRTYCDACYESAQEETLS